MANLDSDESAALGDIDALSDLVYHYVVTDTENSNTEQKALIDPSTPKRKAELIRDFIALANPPDPNFAPKAYLIVGSKNGQFLKHPSDVDIEESKIRNILNSYVYPNLEYEYYPLVFDIGEEKKKVGVFVFTRSGEIHEVGKTLRDDKGIVLAGGQAWYRKGSQKVELEPEPKKALEKAIRSSKLMSSSPRLEFFFYREGSLSERPSAIPCSDILGPIVKEYERKADEMFEFIQRTPPRSHVSPVPLKKPTIGNYPQELEALVAVRDATKQQVRLNAAHFLGKQTEENFFNVGNLRRAHYSGAGLRSSQGSLTGTEDEKNKYKIIHELDRCLKELEGLTDIAARLERKYILAFALSNTGTTPDKNIRIHIHLPPEVQMCDIGILQLPPVRSAIERLIHPDDGALTALFTPSETEHIDVVKMRGHQGSYSPTELERDSFMAGDTWTDLYGAFINWAFGHKIFLSEDKTVLVIEHEEIAHNRSVAFSPCLLVEAAASFEVTYEIRSEAYPEVLTGSLQYTLEESD